MTKLEIQTLLFKRWGTFTLKIYWNSFRAVKSKIFILLQSLLLIFHLKFLNKKVQVCHSEIHTLWELGYRFEPHRRHAPWILRYRLRTHTIHAWWILAFYFEFHTVHSESIMDYNHDSCIIKTGLQVCVCRICTPWKVCYRCELPIIHEAWILDYKLSHMQCIHNEFWVIKMSHLSDMHHECFPDFLFVICHWTSTWMLNYKR